MRVIEEILRALRHYRAFHTALAGFGRHSDQQLGELGIERGDIVRAAFDRAERQAAEIDGADRPVATWPPTVAVSAR